LGNGASVTVAGKVVRQSNEASVDSNGVSFPKGTEPGVPATYLIRKKTSSARGTLKCQNKTGRLSKKKKITRTGAGHKRQPDHEKETKKENQPDQGRKRNGYLAQGSGETHPLLHARKT